MDLGRNLIENEGNLREMGIEWIQITRRDYDVCRIYNEVEQIAQLAVKEDRKRIQYYEENKVKSICWQKASLEAFLSNPFAFSASMVFPPIGINRRGLFSDGAYE